LLVPEQYLFEPLAETLLQNAYEFDAHAGKTIVDIGASIGDFVLIASNTPGVRVYAYEPNRYLFSFLEKNVRFTENKSVRLYNVAANSDTLRSIMEVNQEAAIDFLKIDCEGCEYNVLLNSPSETLSRVARIAMEIHSADRDQKLILVKYLRANGFRTLERRKFGQGTYIMAYREKRID
jgi:predicted RNA methylase